MRRLLFIPIALMLLAGCANTPFGPTMHETEEGARVTASSVVTIEAMKDFERCRDKGFESLEEERTLYLSGLDTETEIGRFQLFMWGQKIGERQAAIVHRCSQAAVQIAQTFNKTDQVKMASNAKLGGAIVNGASAFGGNIASALGYKWVAGAVKGTSYVQNIGSNVLSYSAVSKSGGFSGALVGDSGDASAPPTGGGGGNVTIDMSGDRVIDLSDIQTQMGDNPFQVSHPSDTSFTQHGHASDVNDLLNGTLEGSNDDLLNGPFVTEEIQFEPRSP